MLGGRKLKPFVIKHPSMELVILDFYVGGSLLLVILLQFTMICSFNDVTNFHLLFSGSLLNKRGKVRSSVLTILLTSSSVLTIEVEP